VPALPDLAAARTDKPLAGRVVLVTGAASGLGRHLARAFALAGADLAVAGRSATALGETLPELRALGAQVLPLVLDVVDRRAVAGAVDRVVETFGRVDVLVANSGVSGPSAPSYEVSDQDWDETIAVNLTGAFVCARACAGHMVAARGGVILFIGSMTGKRPLLHRAPYAASKLALVGLCRTMALDLGPYCVRVNVVSPGFVEGERLDWVVSAQAAAQSRPEQEVRRELAEVSPLGRFTDPVDVARTTVFLASDAAAAITGEDVNVSSGVVMF